MSIQFIFGRSGSGKTEYIYQTLLTEAMEHPRKKYYLIVPEQDTLQNQMGMILHEKNAGKGILNIDVLSFSRLAYRVFAELGIEDLKIVDDMGKSMILRDVAESVKEDLRIYARQITRSGFVSQLKSAISEFAQYGISEEMIEETERAAGTPLLSAKFSDLKVIYHAYLEKLRELHMVTAEERMDLLERNLFRSSLFQDAVVAFDGFTGFTPVQNRIMETILKQADRVLCSIWGEKQYRRLPVHELFYMGSDMTCKLLDCASRAGVKEMNSVYLDGRNGRFSKGGELAFLEQHIFRTDRAVYREEARGNLQIYEAEDLFSEVRFVAGKIEAMVREHGYRYRDFGIILSDPASYQDPVYRVFHETEIPYFMDESKSLFDSPLTECIRAALECIDERFSYEAVMRYLRSGFFREEEVLIDRMDNYVRAFGIRGIKAWQEEWNGTFKGMEQIDLKKLNEKKRDLLAPLFRLQEVCCREEKIETLIQAVRNFLEEIQAEEKMNQLSREIEHSGEMDRAREYMAGPSMLEEVLGRCESLMGSVLCQCAEFRQILDAGFLEAGLTTIPATLDQVVIGDVSRSRFTAPKVIFFLGVNAGLVPKAEGESRIISDRERELFHSLSIEVAPTTEENAMIQRFRIYLGMTKPSEYLILSYSLKNTADKSQRPAFMIGEMLRMFPDLQIEKIRDLPKEIYARKEGMNYLSIQLGKSAPIQTDPVFLAVYESLLEESEEVRDLVQASYMERTKSNLSQMAAKLLYGEILSGSITRMEQFNQCAYAHFLRYGLNLCERKSREIMAVDLGNLYHTAIEKSFRKLFDSRQEIQEMDEEVLDGIAEESVTETAEEYGNGLMNQSARNNWILQKVRNVTKTTLWALISHMKRGDFQVKDIEHNFQYMDQNLRLSGRIDRIDLCEQEDTIYVKIIDYKSGKLKFDLNAVCEGLQIQLVVYLDQVMRELEHRYGMKKIVPAAMMYYNIDDPMLEYEEGRTKKEEQQERLKSLKMNGLVNTDFEVVQHLDHEIETASDVIPVVIKNHEVDEKKSSVASTKRFSALRDYVTNLIKEDAERILSGEIQPDPIQENACEYCPYHSVCGFDTKLKGYEYRKLKKRNKDQIWEEIEQREV